MHEIVKDVETIKAIFIANNQTEMIKDDLIKILSIKCPKYADLWVTDRNKFK